MRSKFISALALLMVFVVHSSFAQQRTITGKITDDSGIELPGVSVVVKGTTRGTQSDFDGNYTIQASVGETLVYTYIGQRTEERAVGSSDVINVQMAESAEALEEVVVVGYGQVEDRKLVQNVGRIANDDIRDIPAVTAQELLQGQTSGVQFVQSSGVLGAANVIRIRGVGSLTAGAQPLFVIDGVPLNDNINTFTNGGNTGLNPLQDINPEDIESFSILKDAAATAVYGSRGANGVIIINTKKGRTGTTKVDLNVFTSFSQATDLIPMQNADQYRQYVVDIDDDVDAISDLPQGGFDWVDGVTRTGASQNVNVSISGGNEKSSFFLSTGYRNQEGFVIGNDLVRYSARLNFDHNVNPWLKVGINFGITNTVNDRIGVENNTFAPLTSAYLQLPWVQPYDDEGNFV